MKKPERPPKDKNTNFSLDMMTNPQLLAGLKRISIDYPYWDKFKYLVQKDNFLKKYEASDLWYFFKSFRIFQYSKFTSNNGETFKYSLTNKISQQLHRFDLDLGGSIQSSVIIPSENKEQYFINSIMEEAIASSQLEGAVTTRKIAKDMLRAHRKPKNHSEKMILNNYHTMKEVVARKNEKLTPQMVKDIQSIVTRDTLESYEQIGGFRRSNDIKVVEGLTGEVFYDPPTFDKVDGMMEELCDFINKDQGNPFIHSVLKGITLHFLIGYIHPFVDGNGRTARALFYWYLVKKGYWIVEYLSISRIILKSPAQYSRAYLHTEYDDNDLTYFINYNLKCMSQALEEFKVYVKRKVEQKRDAFELMKTEDINERQAQLLKTLHSEPDKIITIKEMQTLFGVVYQTARTDLMDLEAKKYLRSKTSGKKLIFYKE